MGEQLRGPQMTMILYNTCVYFSNGMRCNRLGSMSLVFDLFLYYLLRYVDSRISTISIGFSNNTKLSAQ